MTPTAQRRLAQGLVWALAGIVVVLGILQLLGVRDHLNLLVFSFMVLTAVVAVITSMGWLSPRNRR